MSGKVSGWVWDQDNLTLQEKYILLSYADHANHDGHNIYPSNELTAKKTNLSVRSIQRYTRSLEDKGFLIPDGKYQAKNGQWTNKWRIPINEGATPVSSLETEGATPVTKRDDTRDQKGRHSSVTQTVIKPSIKPSEEGPKEKPSNNKHPHPPNHPSIQIFRKVMGKWPDKEDGRPMIIDAIGEDPKKLAPWKQHLIGWKLAGYNRLNIAGIVDAFLAGGLRGYGEEAPAKNKTREFLDELREGKNV